METTEGLYHLTPLHYLPHVLQDGALYAKSVLAARGIRPRPSAARRDGMLGLNDWVHLSLSADTPLLRDKIGLGYPHALLVFDRRLILLRPDVALLPYNTKAWRMRSACQPILDPEERNLLLRRHVETGRFPSLEALVHYGLDLTLLLEIRFASEEERQGVADLLATLGIAPPVPLVTSPSLLPEGAPYRPTTGVAVAAYFDLCRTAGFLLPPPLISFD